MFSINITENNETKAYDYSAINGKTTNVKANTDLMFNNSALSKRKKKDGKAKLKLSLDNTSFYSEDKFQRYVRDKLDIIILRDFKRKLYATHNDVFVEQNIL